MVDKHCTQNPAFYISTSSRSSTLRPQNQLSAAQQQHKSLCTIPEGASVTLHTILLGVGGIIYNNHTLGPFKELGLDSQRAKKLASKLHLQFYHLRCQICPYQTHFPVLSSTMIESRFQGKQVTNFHAHIRSVPPTFTQSRTFKISFATSSYFDVCLDMYP